jgi:hypothetical protein
MIKREESKSNKNLIHVNNSIYKNLRSSLAQSIISSEPYQLEPILNHTQTEFKTLAKLGLDTPILVLSR